MNSAGKVVALILIVLALSCKSTQEKKPSPPAIIDSPQSEEPAMEDKIIGSWEWVKTNCCFRNPQVFTADTLGYKKILKFTKDGTLEYYQDKTLSKTETYQVAYGLIEDKRPTLQIDKGKIALLQINNDTLIINYSYMDLQTEFYRKLND